MVVKVTFEKSSAITHIKFCHEDQDAEAAITNARVQCPALSIYLSNGIQLEQVSISRLLTPYMALKKGLLRCPKWDELPRKMH